MSNTGALKIVITGVTRGLGRALAETFIAGGHTVIGCGRSANEIFDLRFTHPAPQDFAVVDVADPAKVDLWAEKVLAVHGAPDFLLNNAALMNEPAPLWKVPADKFSRLIDVNVKGVANMVRAFVPAMIEAKRGVIVNFSSGWGRSVSPDVAPYCASKWAIEGLTQALAAELPKGLAAVPLNPGVIDTDMLRQCWAEGAASYPKAEVWAKKAAAFILKLGPKDNGKPLSVGGFED
ncbi:oxidoreductase [Nibricoccus aquaticus]|uniref:Oxidoreductase n=1 Tax=Nibricoccus aquaticus TaxID=2576891 RepID=A0A290QB23_9BACT|nr:SDR family NAD(P)-dependent oxidoreductase [Nibricoccus aquaticus]ATC62508.1 oxidoreductase [Nibricoccus aquaticus]